MQNYLIFAIFVSVFTCHHWNRNPRETDFEFKGGSKLILASQELEHGQNSNMFSHSFHFLSKQLGWYLHTGDLIQTQKKYAAAGENCNFVMAVNFYPVQRNFWNFLCILFGLLSTQIFNLGTNKFFSKLKNILKNRVQPYFSEFFF